MFVKNLLARAVKNMFFILMNHSEHRGKCSKMCPCHDLSCKYRGQGQVTAQTRNRTGLPREPQPSRQGAGLLTASVTDQLCGLEKIMSLPESQFPHLSKRAKTSVCHCF